ncbi:CFA/I fimbrial subunit C usher protein [Klebsiella aerogenes]|nr:CFA/I fimbrial subunit C usher protein [Klebsiella aerogenes]
MPLQRITPGLKTRLAFGMIFLFVQPDVSAAAAGAQADWRVIIPQAFGQALQDGMSVPLYIHLAGSQSTRDDQRIGSAFIWLDGGQLRVRQIQLEESEGNASVSEQTRQQLIGLANAPFSEALTIPLTDSAQLDLSCASCCCSWWSSARRWHRPALAQRRYRSVQRQRSQQQPEL